ncbi:PREDICTED: cytochrome P450 1B1-like [Aptenodytes forsteri]|uniref:cytochrome P450 1B1-like n=1 Tax=Aptenodytes forsteri TaxID=9233 RepID=UPI0004F4B042|nr:PREDICTED: cytochrome P450 1B1-like [Aptenodytes forsteri]
MPKSQVGATNNPKALVFGVTNDLLHGDCDGDGTRQESLLASNLGKLLFSPTLIKPGSSKSNPPPADHTTQPKPEQLLEVGGRRQTLSRKATHPECDSKHRNPCSTVFIPVWLGGTFFFSVPGDITEQRTQRGMPEGERHVAAEAGDLVRLFLRRSRGGAYFEPSPLLVVANANVLCALCFGSRYSHTDSEFTALLGRNDRFGQTVGAGSMVDVLPWLLHFPNPVRRVFRDFQALNRELHSFVRAKVVQHRQTFDPRTLRDISDIMIAAVERGDRPPEGLGPKDVEGAMTDIFGAGQDTTSTALSWVLLLLLKHPQLQQDLQAELDRVVGRSRLPTAEDRPHLPLLEAFIYETLRYSSFVPITIPHATTDDVEFEGFHIPKGTVVFINQWSVNHDSSKWPDPQRFDPARFLDVQQHLDRDRAGSVMIFSAGQRRCIGDQLSKLQLFLFAAILLHQCSFHANPAEHLTMDCVHGLALKPQPFTVTVRQRHPALIQP